MGLKLISRRSFLASILGVAVTTLMLATVFVNKQYLGLTFTTQMRRAKQIVQKKEPKGLNLVWLLAYPFSGSSVTLNVLQVHSGYSMGTNYGNVMQYQHNTVFRQDFFDSVPVDFKAPNGPFKYRYDLPLPPDGSDILIKNHCSGFCIDEGSRDCNLRKYVIPLLETQHFFEACASGVSFNSKIPERWLRKKAVTYNALRVRKVVLLVRNPFDIVVARFLNAVEGDPSKFESVNHHGLMQWCEKYDSQNGSKYLLSSWYLEEARPYAKIPCHAEFYRITMWYLRALRVIKFLEAKILVVHFEDYELDYGGVTSRLLEFMNVNIANMRGAKGYQRYGQRRHAFFTNEEYNDAVKFITVQGTEEVADLFNRYF